MTASAVVKHRKATVDILPSGWTAKTPHFKDLLNLEAVEETLRHGFPSNRLFCSDWTVCHDFRVSSGNHGCHYWLSSVWMQKRSRSGFSSPDCHGQRVHDQVFGNAVGSCPYWADILLSCFESFKRHSTETAIRTMAANATVSNFDILKNGVVHLFNQPHNTTGADLHCHNRL